MPQDVLSPDAQASGLVALIEQIFFHERKNACKSPDRVWAIGYDETAKKLVVLRPDCRRWDCPHCSEVLAKEWIIRAMMLVQASNDPAAWDFVTLTLSEKLRDFRQTSHVFGDAWRKLYQALKRNGGDFSYFGVPELHKNGRVHFHMLTNYAVPDTYTVKRRKVANKQVRRMRHPELMDRFWKDVPRAYGWGYANDQEHLHGDTAKTAGYLAKYLGKQRKANKWAKGFRHVRTSHDCPDLPDDNQLSEDFSWQIALSESDLRHKLEIAAAGGYRWIDPQTGELLN